MFPRSVTTTTAYGALEAVALADEDQHHDDTH
jgi:hypothetical protein